jgi:hypothetical protein
MVEASRFRLLWHLCSTDACRRCFITLNSIPKIAAGPLMLVLADFFALVFHFTSASGTANRHENHSS